MGLQFFNKSFDLNIKEGKLTFLTIVWHKKKPYGFIIPTLNLSFLEKFIGLDCSLVKNEKIWLLSCARPYLKKIG